MWRLRWLELGVLLMAGLFAWGFHLTLPSRLPEAADHQSAAAFLQANFAEGDVVLLHPWWTERARLFLPEHVPVVGYFGSDAADLREHPRIWVLSQPSLPRSDRGGFDEAFLPERTPVGEAQSFGPLRLQLYENGRHRRPLWRAIDALSQAQVFLEDASGQRRVCRGNGQRFQCPGGAQLYVAVEWHEVLYEPRRCLNLHAPGGDARLVVEFPNAPAAEYELSAGIIWEHAFRHEPHRTPTRVESRVADAGLEVVLPVGFEGLKHAAAASGGGPVRIAISSPVAETRQACVSLTGWEMRP